MTWLQCLGLLDEHLINRRRTGAKAAIVQLVGRIANDYVELHSASKHLGNSSLDVVGVNERIGVTFHLRAAIQGALACPAKGAFAICPGMLDAFKPDIARLAVEMLGNGMGAIGVLRAIQAAARQQAGQVRNANAEHLLGQNVNDALLKVWDLRGKTLGKAAGDLTEKHARLCAGVKEPH